MGCGCGKKKKGFNPLFPESNKFTADPEDWGPDIWLMLHCFAEKIGYQSNPIIQSDESVIFQYLVNNLPNILPCQECQSHAKSYIQTHPTLAWSTLRGQDLRSAIRIYLFAFHNSVRIRTNKPIIIHTPEECAIAYQDCEIKECYFNTMKEYISIGVRNGWVKSENWKRWVIQFTKLKILLGIK
jgi:hypothetical protein